MIEKQEKHELIDEEYCVREGSVWITGKGNKSMDELHSTNKPYIKNLVSVQNPFWLNDQLLCKTENRKFFSTLNLCYFVDKNNDFIQR